LEHLRSLFGKSPHNQHEHQQNSEKNGSCPHNSQKDITTSKIDAPGINKQSNGNEENAKNRCSATDLDEDDFDSGPGCAYSDSDEEIIEDVDFENKLYASLEGYKDEIPPNSQQSSTPENEKDRFGENDYYAEDEEALLKASSSLPLPAEILAGRGQSPLYPGSPVTLMEFHALFVRFMTQTHLAACEISTLLKLLRIITPGNEKENLIPKSFASLKKDLQFQMCQMDRMYHCATPNCSNENEVTNEAGCCPVCKQHLVSQFFQRKMSDIVKERFAKEEYWIKLDWKNNPKQSGEEFSDITKSAHYRREADLFTNTRGNYTASLFTDGGAAFDKSNHSLWPILVVLNEFDPKIRFRPEEVYLLGFFHSISWNIPFISKYFLIFFGFSKIFLVKPSLFHFHCFLRF